jgi:hypothetical protein
MIMMIAPGRKKPSGSAAPKVAAEGSASAA